MLELSVFRQHAEKANICIHHLEGMFIKRVKKSNLGTTPNMQNNGNQITDVVRLAFIIRYTFNDHL